MNQNAKKLPTFLFKDGAKGLLVTSKYVLDSLNLWSENQNWFSKLMHTFYSIGYVYFLFGNLYFLFTSTDTDAIVYCLTIFGVIIEAILRRVSMYVYRHRINKLLKDIYFLFWPSTLNGDELHKQLKNEAGYLLAYCIAYTISAFISVGIITILPLSKMSAPYVTAYPFNWHKNPYYSILYAWEGMCFVESVSTICGWNLFFASLAYNCVAQFKLLKTYIKQNFLNNRHDILKQKTFITKCVLHHYTILRLSEELNQIFYFFILSLFLSSIQCCCLSAFVVTALPDLFLFGCSYFLGHICQLFLYCYLGNELAFESMDLATTIYTCGWETCDSDKDVRSSLRMIILRAKRPVQISAGGFGYLHLSSFMKILQFTFSVYTLLKTMMQKGLL